MEFGFNKNLRLYLRTQHHRNTRTKLGKGKEKNPRGFTTITHRKENFNKPGHPPAEILQNIRKNIDDFF